MNLAVASWVAEAGVDENMALAILDTSPAHLLSINTMRHEASVPSWLEDVLHVAAQGIDLAVAEGAKFSEARKRQIQSAANQLTGTKHVHRLAPQTFLLAMNRIVAFIDRPKCLGKLKAGFVAAATCYLKLRANLYNLEEPQTAVAVGVVNMLDGDSVWDQHDFELVSSMIQDCEPRFLMGHFGSNPQGLRQLAADHFFRGTQPFVQYWCFNERVMFYPNFIMALGPCGDCQNADREKAPEIADYLGRLSKETRVCVEKSLKQLFNLPNWGWQELQESDYPKHFANLGPCKQKPYADKWHVDGLHQVMVFCGTARSSHNSSARRYQEGLTGKGKDNSKGKGKSKCKGKRRRR